MLLKARFWWGGAVAAALSAVLLAAWRGPEPGEVLQVQFFKQVGEHEAVELLSGDSLVSGDDLYMTVTARDALHLYVVSEDTVGERLIIYPCRTWGQSPRLAANQLFRLPGRELFWPVRSVTPRERLLVIASTRPIDLLNAAFTAAESPEPCAVPVSREASRWIDGLEKPPAGFSLDPLWQPGDRNPETWISTLDLKGAADHG